jgi:hypothetical protein
MTEHGSQMIYHHCGDPQPCGCGDELLQQYRGLERRLSEVEAESAGRLKVLNEQVAAAKTEWLRAERAEARAQGLEKALRDVTGEAAERLAEDMDHQNRDHSKWYRAVKRAHKMLSSPSEQEEVRS